MIIAMLCWAMIMTTAAAEETPWIAGRENEQPAPPDPLVVMTSAGIRLTGAAARVDIKYRAAEAPEVEVALSASNKQGWTWTVQALAPSNFLETLTWSAPVVGHPLQPGHASVQLSRLGADAAFASSGLLTLRLQAGRLIGEASGMEAEFSAKFEGPFAVTCAVPAASLAAEAPASTSINRLSPLVLDEKFESALCKRFTTLAGWSR